MTEPFEQLRGGLRILQPDRCFRIGTDSMLLADFLTLRPGAQVADLGCGTGVLAFLLAARRGDCRVTGIELQPDACETALRSVRLNALEDRVRILQADLRQIRNLLPGGGFHAAIANPPYFPPGSGKAAAQPARAGARSEQTCTLPQLCAAAAWLVRTGGYFALVHRPERLCDLMCALRACGLEPKRLRFARHTARAKPSVVLLESKRGAKPGLTLEPDLVLFEDDGSPSADYRRIYAYDPTDEHKQEV